MVGEAVLKLRIRVDESSVTAIGLFDSYRRPSGVWRGLANMEI